jgi:adenosine/AMP kinase
MPITNPPRHLRELLTNVQEVQQLMQLHSATVGKGPGRKYGVAILNKSAIVLIVACWEAYVEDLAELALDHLLTHAKDHTAFPRNVLDIVANKNTGAKAWNLAGNGWKTAIRNNFKEVLAKTTGSLNTPKTTQVNELFEKTIGFAAMSTKWTWPGSNAADASSRLDQLVNLRGSIAHRVKASKSVHKKDVDAAIELISRLAARSNNEIHDHLLSLGTVPSWGRYKYKKTS